MSLATINGIPAVELEVTLPRSGRWHMDAVLDTDVASGIDGQPVSVQLGASLMLSGVCTRAGEYGGQVSLEVVGGAAGLLQSVLPKAFGSPTLTLQLPLTDALGAVGETLSPSSDAVVLSTPLTRWIRVAATVAEEVAGLLAQAPAGAVGRMLPDGTLWVGVDKYLDSGLTPLDYQLLRDDSHRGQAEIGVDDARLAPGTTFLGRKVEQVTHTLKADKLRTTVQFASASLEPASTTHDNDLDQVILRRVRPTRYMRAFPASVLRQNADGTLELKLDDINVPGLSAVPIREFAPGVSVQVAASSRCRVVFAGGNPQSPEVVSFEAGPGSTTSITIQAPVVNIGSTTPGDAAALASKVMAGLEALTAAFNGHTHAITVTGVQSGAGTGVGASTAPPPAPAPSPVASSNLLLQS